jgi:hypothetical protein
MVFYLIFFGFVWCADDFVSPLSLLRFLLLVLFFFPVVRAVIPLASTAPSQPGIPIGSPFHPSNRLAVQQTGLGANNPFGQRQQQNGAASGGGQPSSTSQNEQPFFSV